MPVPTPKVYKLTAREYAEQYGCSESTIVRYKAGGAPLDNPAKMAAWMAATNSRQKPAGMKFEVVDAEEGPQEQGLVKYQGGDAADEIDAEIETEEVGARAEIEALGKESAKARRQYVKHRGHPVLGPLHLKTWTTLANTLRQLSKDTPRAEKDDSKSVSIEEVEASLTRNLLEIKNQVELIPSKIRKALEHIDDEIMVEVEEIMRREIAYTVKSLQSASWLTTE